jgi:hypothetical protein
MTRAKLDNLRITAMNLRVQYIHVVLGVLTWYVVAAMYITQRPEKIITFDHPTPFDAWPSRCVLHLVHRGLHPGGEKNITHQRGQNPFAQCSQQQVSFG